MGDPRKQRRKYASPKHPWRAERITEENEIAKKHGLKTKREIWRAKSTVGRYRQQARLLLASSGEETEKESKELLTKLNKLGIMDSPNLDDVLALTVENLLNRRLQTIVFTKGLARTPKQARQLIVHKHVVVGKNIVDVPRYIVAKDEEDKIRLRIELKEGESAPKSTAKDAAESAEKPKQEKPSEETKTEEEKPKAEEEKTEQPKQEPVEEAKKESKAKEEKSKDEAKEEKPAENKEESDDKKE